MSQYHSQYKQDLFLDKVVFNGKEDGFFVDIGAHDGITISNSFFFEKCRNWDGVCVEPNPNVFSQLINNRKGKNLNICLGDGNKAINFTKIEGYAEMLSGVTKTYAPEHLKRINKEVSIHGGNIETISVEMRRFDAIAEFKDKKIDFISIDTEGNELDIIKSIDFRNSIISCFVIENNYNDHQIYKILTDNHFQHIIKLNRDDVYLHRDCFNLYFKCRLTLWKVLASLKRGYSKFYKK